MPRRNATRPLPPEASVFVPSKNRGVPHISLVFREMWETTNLNLFPDLQKEAGGMLRYPISREKRARYGAPHDSWKGQNSQPRVPLSPPESKYQAGGEA